MKSPRLLTVLTLANLVLLLVLLAERVRPAMAQSELPMLRGRGLEIVDGQGRVRASIGVMPPAQPGTGVETVLLRLITDRGRPSVKIGASESQSGLSFAGPTGTQQTYVILEAKGTSSQMKLRAEGGQEQVLKP